MNTRTVSPATVWRLTVYRRWVTFLIAKGQTRVFSHDLAAQGQVTAAQARRDLRTIGFRGSCAHGYDVAGLKARIDELLHPSGEESFALIGLGQVGRIVLGYLISRRLPMRFSAAFDIDPEVIGQASHGVRCFSMEELPRLAQECAIRVAVLTVPAHAAQDAASALEACGFRGILNFAPVRLNVSPAVYVENVDIATLLARTAFFARQPCGTVEVAS